ncbi:alcohol dehydrogenase 1-like [Sitophilus oryzae]|uniref:Alcohol dehydrogenase 1-like n=1 Tax=Sitophilus oryzae TaxID=7048 RepID=A0A6J2XDN8_SITOR|nr:alcohol dehydrogenase 1-like [Sitophilus oryzae]
MDIHDSLLKAKSELKSVDMVINTFGIWDEKQWEYEVNLNLMGTLNVNQLAEDVITKPGMVLNVVGLSGTEPFSPSPVLAGSFHGVIGYTRSKGHEQNFMRTGIRVVALCSGITESPFTKDVIKKICCPHMSNDLKAYLDEACWQKPEVVAKAIVEVYKCGDSGSVWIVEGSRLFSLKIPDLKAHRVLENQFI